MSKINIGTVGGKPFANTKTANAFMRKYNMQGSLMAMPDGRYTVQIDEALIPDHMGNRLYNPKADPMAHLDAMSAYQEKAALVEAGQLNPDEDLEEMKRWDARMERQAAQAAPEAPEAPQAKQVSKRTAKQAEPPIEPPRHIPVAPEDVSNHDINLPREQRSYTGSQGRSQSSGQHFDMDFEELFSNPNALEEFDLKTLKSLQKQVRSRKDITDEQKDTLSEVIAVKADEAVNAKKELNKFKSDEVRLVEYWERLERTGDSGLPSADKYLEGVTESRLGAALKSVYAMRDIEAGKVSAQEAEAKVEAKIQQQVDNIGIAKWRQEQSQLAKDIAQEQVDIAYDIAVRQEVEAYDKSIQAKLFRIEEQQAEEDKKELTRQVLNVYNAEQKAKKATIAGSGKTVEDDSISWEDYLQMRGKETRGNTVLEELQGKVTSRTIAKAGKYNEDKLKVEERVAALFAKESEEQVLADQDLAGNTKAAIEELIVKPIAEAFGLLDKAIISTGENLEDFGSDMKDLVSGTAKGTGEIIEGGYEVGKGELGKIFETLAIGAKAVIDLGNSVADNAFREVTGGASTGFTRSGYAGLIKQLGLGQQVSSQVIQSAAGISASVMQSPDALEGILERLATADALGGGSGFDIQSFAMNALQGKTEDNINLALDYAKQNKDKPQVVQAVLSSIGMEQLAWSEAGQVATEDAVTRDERTLDILRERINLEEALADGLGGNLTPAVDGATEAIKGFTDIALSMKESVQGSLTNTLVGAPEDGESFTAHAWDKVGEVVSYATGHKYLKTSDEVRLGLLEKGMTDALGVDYFTRNPLESDPQKRLKSLMTNFKEFESTLGGNPSENQLEQLNIFQQEISKAQQAVTSREDNNAWAKQSLQQGSPQINMNNSFLLEMPNGSIVQGHVKHTTQKVTSKTNQDLGTQ